MDDERWRLLERALARGGGPTLPRAALRDVASGSRGMPASPAGRAAESEAICSLAARSAVAFRRWRGEPRDADALDEGVANLRAAAEAYRELAGPGADERLAEVVGKATLFGPADALEVVRKVVADPRARIK